MMENFGLYNLISTVVNVVFMGGFVVSILTIRAQRKKATGDAKQSIAVAEGLEIDNVEKAAKIWRETTEMLKKELDQQRAKSDELARQIELLRIEISKMQCTTNRILRLVERITPDNIERTIQEIKNLVKNP